MTSDPARQSAPLRLSDKAMIDANHEACAAYDDEIGEPTADPQAMGAAIRAVLRVVEREIAWRLT